MICVCIIFFYSWPNQKFLIISYPTFDEKVLQIQRLKKHCHYFTLPKTGLENIPYPHKFLESLYFWLFLAIFFQSVCLANTVRSVIEKKYQKWLIHLLNLVFKLKKNKTKYLLSWLLEKDFLNCPNMVWIIFLL